MRSPPAKLSFRFRRRERSVLLRRRTGSRNRSYVKRESVSGRFLTKNRVVAHCKNRFAGNVNRMLAEHLSMRNRQRRFQLVANKFDIIFRRCHNP